MPSTVQKVFPATVLDGWLPPREWFTEDHVPDSWETFVHRLFMGRVQDIALIPKEGIDPDTAWQHATMILGSFQPKHEHKIEGVAWLLWHWFESGEYVYPDADQRTYTLRQTEQAEV
jgi:hypothetical protein